MMISTTSKEGYLRYEDTELDKDSWRIVKHEIKESEENKKKCLDILKKKLSAKEDLYANTNDTFLLSFLRVSKYDCDKAYQRLIRYYEDKRSMPEVFDEYLPSSIEVVKTARYLYLSPYRIKKDNSALVIWKRGVYDPLKHPYELIIRYMHLAGEFALLHKLNQICGITIIIDMKTSSSSWTSWSEITPGRLKLSARLMQKTMPLRIRGIHIVNASPIYYLFYSIIYPFLTVKMRNRMHVHRSYASLHACIGAEILPKTYGGHLEQTDLINVYEKLCDKEEYFAKISKYGFIKKKK